MNCIRNLLLVLLVIFALPVALLVTSGVLLAQDVEDSASAMIIPNTRSIDLTSTLNGHDY